MSVRVPAGEMRHVLRLVEHKIESASTAYDTFGMVSASSTAWRSVATVRGKIDDMRGTKEHLSRQQHPTATHLVTIDYIASLATTGGPRRAFSFSNRMLYIRSVENPDQENRQLQVVCSESL